MRLAALAIAAGLSSAVPVLATPPSIIIIVTDDQRWDTIGLTHSPDGVRPVMPAVKRWLVDEGVMFANAFCTTPLCGPGRASLLTGRYAQGHRIINNSAPYSALDTQRIVIRRLHDAGYTTGLIGKYLNQYGYDEFPDWPASPIPPAYWDEWYVHPKNGHYFGQTFASRISGQPLMVDTHNIDTTPEGSATSYTTDIESARAVDFLRRHSGEQKLLWIAPKAPHGDSLRYGLDELNNAPHPAARHRDSFDGVSPWDHSRVPSIPEGFELPAPWDPYLVDRQRELESLQAVDDLVDSVMTQVEANGELGNTVVIFTSDNGYLWGEHATTSKGVALEESIRVPLVVRDPLHVTAPATSAALALNIDLAPTLLDLAGLSADDQMDGQSLVPLLASPSAAGRGHFFGEGYPDPVGNPIAWVMMRDSRWKLVETCNMDTLESTTELYDLQTDPYEMTNLAQVESQRTDAMLLTMAGEFHLTAADPPPPSGDIIFKDGFEQ